MDFVKGIIQSFSPQNSPFSNLTKVKPIPYFAEKRIVITGASSGIGKALAFWFLNEGSYVALCGRDMKTLNYIGEQFPSQAISVQCDLSIDIQQYDMCTSIVEKLGGDRTRGIDILINCAGLIFDGDIETTFPQDFDYLMDINLRAPFHLTQMLMPFLQKANGCVVNISSECGSRPTCGCISYSMTKAGLEMLTKCMALEVAPSGVRVNAVAPGPTDTNFMRYAGLSEAEYSQYVSRASNNVPLKVKLLNKPNENGRRLASAEEIAKAVIFLCSEKAKHITGYVLKIDGGKNLTSSNYIHWNGHEIMNRRFEPNSINYLGLIGKTVSEKIFKSPKPVTGSPDWCADKQKSNWATHLDNAHSKVTQNYAKISPEDDALKQYLDDQIMPIYKQGDEILRNSPNKFL